MIKILIGFVLIFSQTRTLAAEADNSERSPVVSSTSAAPSIQNSANTTQKQNNSAGALSKIVGVVNMGIGAVNAASCGPQCGSCCAMAVLHFAMGALSFKQASNHSGTSGQSSLTGVDTSAWKDPFGNPNASEVNHLSTDDSSKDAGLAAAVNTGKFNEIKKNLFGSGINGIKMDPKTGKITDSNSGKTYDSAALNSAKSMADAGFSPSDISTAMDAASKAEKAAMKKLGLTEGIGAATAENGYIEGSGGTGGAGAMTGSSADSTNYSGGRGLASSGGAVKIPSNQIAGLTKNFNGERIGVSAENIFHMMNRRYKTKEKQNSFLDPSELVKMPQ
ncbi:MAG: hypothetical protein JNL11_13060 [Bdellovibrionaceae bacterium]|nr:hypothetical protein [Pseudobdellovibrionaceae bacterium]